MMLQKERMPLNRKTLAVALVYLLATLVLTGVVVAQVSDNFDVSWSAIAGTGGARESAEYQIQDTLGQSAAGSSASANYGIESGFWAFGVSHLAGDSYLYLPVVIR
jgi:hypothetical protein